MTVKARKPDTGLVKPYRPKPNDFRETFIALGWECIEEHYQTNWRVIRRWIDMEGREDLIAARRAHVEAIWAERRLKRKRYVLGRTVTAVTVRRQLRDDEI